MTIRESTEQWESDYLSPYASLSKNSRGRDRYEPPCDIRPVYQRDRDRILHCKSFRRLKHKTQVFLTPRGDHYRTRLTPTLEGKLVRFSDKIAYINHDIDDAIRAGILEETDIPKEYRDILGSTTRERLNTLVHDVISQSMGKPDICMSAGVEGAMHALRSFMFNNVYTNPIAKGEEVKARNMLEGLFSYYMEHPEELSDEFKAMLASGRDPLEIVVCDYISGMTDQYAIYKFEEYFVPKAWNA